MQKLLEKYFQISHDASATLIVTLLIFLLGYCFTAVFYIVSQYSDRRSNRKIFISNLRILAKNLKRQEDGLRITLDSMNFTKNTHWNYDKVDFFPILTIREMGFKETFKSFFLGMENKASCKTKIKRKAFNKIWGIISNTEFWSTKALNDFYSFLKSYNDVGDKRNSEMQELRKMWETMLSVNPAQLLQNEFDYLDNINSLLSQYAQIPTNERVAPFVTHRKLILPFRILNKKNRGQLNVQNFNDKCMAVSATYHDMEHLMRVTKAQYTVYYKMFREYHKLIEKIITILK